MNSNGNVFALPSRTEMYSDLKKVTRELQTSTTINSVLLKDSRRMRIYLTLLGFLFGLQVLVILWLLRVVHIYIGVW